MNASTTACTGGWEPDRFFVYSTEPSASKEVCMHPLAMKIIFSVLAAWALVLLFFNVKGLMRSQKRGMKNMLRQRLSYCSIGQSFIMLAFLGLSTCYGPNEFNVNSTSPFLKASFYILYTLMLGNFSMICVTTLFIILKGGRAGDAMLSADEKEKAEQFGRTMDVVKQVLYAMLLISCIAWVMPLSTANTETARKYYKAGCAIWSVFLGGSILQGLLYLNQLIGLLQGMDQSTTINTTRVGRAGSAVIAKATAAKIKKNTAKMKFFRNQLINGSGGAAVWLAQGTVLPSYWWLMTLHFVNCLVFMTAAFVSLLWVGGKTGRNERKFNTEMTPTGRSTTNSERTRQGTLI
jgi:hypothetical protein